MNTPTKTVSELLMDRWAALHVVANANATWMGNNIAVMASVAVLSQSRHGWNMGSIAVLIILMAVVVAQALIVRDAHRESKAIIHLSVQAINPVHLRNKITAADIPVMLGDPTANMLLLRAWRHRQRVSWSGWRRYFLGDNPQLSLDSTRKV